MGKVIFRLEDVAEIFHLLRQPLILSNCAKDLRACILMLLVHGVYIMTQDWHIPARSVSTNPDLYPSRPFCDPAFSSHFMIFFLISFTLGFGEPFLARSSFFLLFKIDLLHFFLTLCNMFFLFLENSAWKGKTYLTNCFEIIKLKVSFSILMTYYMTYLGIKIKNWK